jgi:hypothetical protein
MFGMDEEEKTRIANMLNCQLGGLPMKYLGVTVSDVKLGRGAFKNVSEKISKRTPSWQGKQMSSRARLILSNNYLSSLPTYMMDFYLLPLSTHKEMDGIRSKFFRRGAGTEFKYHMIKCPAVCRPKKFGGLGIVNTQVFNVCLMTKWIWKLYNHKNCLWVRLLTAKYMRDEDFFKSKGTQGSQFWKSLHKVKHMFKWGAVHKVGNGKRTQLWNDVWIASTPLRICFPRLYAICEDQNISVGNCAQVKWEIDFRRLLGPREYQEWSELQSLLRGVNITSEDDEICWGLAANKKFSTSSLYEFITNGVMNNKLTLQI